MKIEFRTRNWENADEKAAIARPEITLCPPSEIALKHGAFVVRVKGSTGNKYKVAIWESGDKLHSKCECQGAARGYGCYHVAAAYKRMRLFINGKVLPHLSAIKRDFAK